MTVTVICYRQSLDILHDEVGKTILRSAAVNQTGNEWAFQSRQNLSFVAEAADRKLVFPPAPDQFYGYQLCEFPIGTRCKIHRSHSAASDLLFQAVSADARIAQRKVLLF